MSVNYGTSNYWVLRRPGGGIKDVTIYDFNGNQRDISVLKPREVDRIQQCIISGEYMGRFHPDNYDEEYLIEALAKMGLNFDVTHTGDIEHQYVCKGSDPLAMMECGHCFALRGKPKQSWYGWYCPACGFPSGMHSVDTEYFDYLRNYIGEIDGMDLKPILGAITKPRKDLRKGSWDKKKAFVPLMKRRR